MGALSWIPKIFTGTKDVAEVFKENAEKKGERAHAEKMEDLHLDQAVLKQFASEFHERQKRTWWDSLVDGLNRLPRPLLTFSVLSFFVIAPLYPTKFLEIAQAYSLMPNGYWALLSVIVGFYFGGRMQLKAQDMSVKGDALQAAKNIVAMRKEFRALTDDDEPHNEKVYRSAVSSGVQELPNIVVNNWKAGKK